MDVVVVIIIVITSSCDPPHDQLVASPLFVRSP